MNEPVGSLRQTLKDSWSDWGPFLGWASRRIVALLIGGAVVLLGEWANHRVFGAPPTGPLAILGASALVGLEVAIGCWLVVPLLESIRKHARSPLRTFVFGFTLGLSCRLFGLLAGNVAHLPGPLWMYLLIALVLSITGWCVVDKIPARWFRGVRTWFWKDEIEPPDDVSGAHREPNTL